MKNNKSKSKAVKQSFSEMRNDVSELLKPIAVHEAKSAVYKAKLAGYLLKKGASGAKTATLFLGKQGKKALDAHKAAKAKKETDQDKTDDPA